MKAGSTASRGLFSFLAYFMILYNFTYIYCCCWKKNEQIACFSSNFIKTKLRMIHAILVLWWERPWCVCNVTSREMWFIQYIKHSIWEQYNREWTFSLSLYIRYYSSDCEKFGCLKTLHSLCCFNIICPQGAIMVPVSIFRHSLGVVLFRNWLNYLFLSLNFILLIDNAWHVHALP